jgi:hypothetical protein
MSALQMENMLFEYPNLNIMFNTVFIDTAVQRDSIRNITVFSKGEGKYYTIEAKLYVDCTADICVARNAGCEAMFGEDEQDRYSEPSAPLNSTNIVNGVTLVFRTSPSDSRQVDPVPGWVKDTNAEDWIKKDNKPGAARYYMQIKYYMPTKILFVPGKLNELANEK